MPMLGNDSANTDFDAIVVGGGVNGAGIARDLAGRGARVLLCEKDDLASHTSSSSTTCSSPGEPFDRRSTR